MVVSSAFAGLEFYESVNRHHTYERHFITANTDPITMRPFISFTRVAEGEKKSKKRKQEVNMRLT